MKKLFFIGACFILALSAKAQTVTQAQLQGKWRLVGFVNYNGAVDVVKGTWKLNEGVKETDENAVELYKGIIAQGKDAVLEIKGATATQQLSDGKYEAIFTLEDKNGKTYMTMDEGTTGSPQVFIKDGQMHLLDEDTKIDMEMIYGPVK